MLLKRKIVVRFANLALIFLALFVIVLGAYFFIFFQTKVSAINVSLNILKESLATADVFGAISENIAGISWIFSIQFFLFILIIFSLIFGSWYVLQLYLVESRNALVDPLTNIYNKRAILYGLKREMERTERYKHSTSIAMLDLDFFKKYNDTSGHVAGDKLLIRFAKILRAGIRDYDLVGRFGGEEFLIIFPETKLKEAVDICVRIRKVLERTEFFGQEKMPLGKITASIGVAEYDGKKKLSEENFMQKADQFLYKAKEMGRNLVIWND